MNERHTPSDTCRYIHTPGGLARRHLLYVQEAGHLKSSGRHISSRSHLESFLFFIVLSGSGTVTLDGARYPLKAGDHVFLDCRRTYAHESSEEDPWELLWVHFQGKAMEGYCEYLARQAYTPVFRPAAPSPFQPLLEQLLRLEELRLDSRELLENSLLHQLVTCLLTRREAPEETQSGTWQKLQEVRRYLEENFTEKISLDELANRFYISKYHLSREFKKAFGVTPVSFLNAQRITRAKEMLRFTDLQIESIARACGIEDNSYFNKVFRKAEGITAREYRRKWRGQ